MAKAVGQFTIIDLNDITISSTAPAVKIVDMIWLDTSVVPNQLKKWSGTAWINVGDRNADIKLGDRNLILNSGVLKKNTSYPIATYDLAEPIAAGETVTLVIKGSLGTGKTHFQPYNSGGSVSIPTLKVNSTDFVNGIAVKTGTWAVGSSTNTKLYLYPFPSSVTGVESTIEWVKLVRGDMTSKDWTPAPEDTDQKFTNYYTKTETATQINAAKDSINLSVDTKISTATTTINQTTDEKLEDYSTTNEMTAAINLKGAEIDLAVSQKIIGNYYQETAPETPKNKEFWYKTEHSNYIVNNMSMSVNSLTGVTVNGFAPVQKLYRYNGTVWQLVEDSDITNLKSDIAGINITTEKIMQKVEGSDGRLGQLEITASSITSKVSDIEGNIGTLQLTASALNVEIQNVKGDIGTLQLTASALNAEIQNVKGDIGTLELTSSNFETRISGAEGNISSIKQVSDSIALAVNASKLIFNTSGLTIDNGGFFIKNGSTTLLNSTGGNLFLRGEIRTGYATLNSNGLYLQPYQGWDGNPSGGRVYFDSSNNRLIVEAQGWSVLIRTSTLSYGIGNTNHNFYGGDLDIIAGDLRVRGEKYIKKRLTDVKTYDYVLAYIQ